MAAGGGNLQRAARSHLSLDVEHVGIRRWRQAHHRLVDIDPPRIRFARVCAQMLDHLQQRLCGINGHLPDQRCLVGALIGHDKTARATSQITDPFVAVLCGIATVTA